MARYGHVRILLDELGLKIYREPPEDEAAERRSRGLLNRLAVLSTKGDPEIGRKAAATPEPITPAERDWLEAVVVRLIRRIGEVAAGGDALPQITLADFPPLT